MFLLFVTQDKIGDRSQLSWSPLCITAGGNDQSLRVSASRQPQPVTRLAVSDMGNRTGIGNIDISRIAWGYDLKPRFSEATVQGLSLCLIELTPQSVEADSDTSTLLVHVSGLYLLLATAVKLPGPEVHRQPHCTP